MDKRKILLLTYLLKHCGNSFKVLDTKDILNDLPKYKGDYDKFSQDIEALQELKYVDLKYKDEDSICLCVLENSTKLAEDQRVKHTTRNKNFCMIVLLSILCGACSFIGTALALLLFR